VESKLLKQVNRLANLEQSWRVIYANGRFSKSEDVRNEIQRFAKDSSSNIRRLQRRLSRGEFRFQPAKGVPIPKLDARGKPTGRFRPIVLAPVESRIVQRAILNVLLEIPALQRFAKTPLSVGGLRRDRSDVALELPKHEVPSAVPAAIQAALGAIRAGAKFSATADIASFFTKIPKPHVIGIISDAVDDADFTSFVEDAVAVELSNLASLRDKAEAFPIEDIGVAQGNSLSPLLGNLILADFDREMNDGDCACIRYIDDFLILATSEKAGNARLKKATRLLEKLGMSLSPEKSSKGVRPLNDGIEFLGIQICPGVHPPQQ
jgi:retron-type reverse transcriptase